MKVYRPVPESVVSRGSELHAVDGDVRIVGIVDDNLDPHLMHGVIAHLENLLPDASVRLWVKPIGTSPAPESLIEEMAREIQVAVAGVGM
jgi:hypothetical protein